MKKILLINVLLIGFSSMAAENNYQLQVNGLACPFCEYNIQKKLSKIEGVSDVTVNLKKGLVNVKMLEGQKLPETQVRQEITDAGFTLKGIKTIDNK